MGPRAPQGGSLATKNGKWGKDNKVSLTVNITIGGRTAGLPAAVVVEAAVAMGAAVTVGAVRAAEATAEVVKINSAAGPVVGLHSATPEGRIDRQPGSSKRISGNRKVA